MLLYALKMITPVGIDIYQPWGIVYDFYNGYGYLTITFKILMGKLLFN